jgi:hypothetical protein
MSFVELQVDDASLSASALEAATGFTKRHPLPKRSGSRQ